MEIVYVLVGIVALVAVYFLFLRKQAPEKLEAPPKRQLVEPKEVSAGKREAPKPSPPKSQWPSHAGRSA